MTSEILDKMTFSVHLPLLTRATSDSEEQTPGYMLTQIEEITYQPSPSSEMLGEYLTRKLDKPSSCVKLKVLKIIIHLARDGHASFRKYLRSHDAPIKSATSYSGPPHPLLGTSPYESVRKNAQELLRILFDPDLIHEDEEGQIAESRSKTHLAGLGSSVGSKGKYEGFGYTAKEKEETVKDKAMDILIKLIHPSDDSNEIIKQALTSNSGEYEPVKVESLTCTQAQDVPQSTESLRFKVKSHVPGRAGGGWESDEDEKSLPNVQLQSVNSDSNLSSDSLERCCALNCVDVIKATREALVMSFFGDKPFNENQILRSLLIVEWFLRTDFVPISYYVQLISPKLNDILKIESKTELAIKKKAHKLNLIIGKLQSRTG